MLKFQKEHTMNFQVDVDLDKIMKACWTLLQILVDIKQQKNFVFCSKSILADKNQHKIHNASLSYNANVHFGFNNKIQLRTT